MREYFKSDFYITRPKQVYKLLGEEIGNKI